MLFVGEYIVSRWIIYCNPDIDSVLHEERCSRDELNNTGCSGPSELFTMDVSLIQNSTVWVFEQLQVPQVTVPCGLQTSHPAEPTSSLLRGSLVSLHGNNLVPAMQNGKSFQPRSTVTTESEEISYLLQDSSEHLWGITRWQYSNKNNGFPSTTPAKHNTSWMLFFYI